MFAHHLAACHCIGRSCRLARLCVHKRIHHQARVIVLGRRCPGVGV
jgi:hypothetical protein